MFRKCKFTLSLPGWFRRVSVWPGSGRRSPGARSPAPGPQTPASGPRPLASGPRPLAPGPRPPALDPPALAPQPPAPVPTTGAVSLRSGTIIIALARAIVIGRFDHTYVAHLVLCASACVCYKRSTHAMPLDLFALACDDIASSDEDPASPPPLPPPRDLPGTVVAEPPGAVVAEPPCATPRKLPRAKASAGPRHRPTPKPVSKLCNVSLGEDPATWSVAAVFFTDLSGAREEDGRSKRPRLADLQPVTIWPQYTIAGLDGIFVVASVAEPWLAAMLRTLRQRHEHGSAADATTRILSRNLSASLRVLVRKGLASIDGHAPVDEPDDIAYNVKKRARTFSGLAIEDCFLFDVTLAEHPITMVNYGRQLIFRLDDNGMRFINTALVTLIKKLSSSAADVATADPVPSEKASFSFEDSTPNVRDKVMWCTRFNGWKLLIMPKNGTLKKATHTCEDDSGRSLKVDLSLAGADFEEAKQHAYQRAIAAWNVLDTSSRYRITGPLVGLRLHGVPNPETE